MNGFAVDQDVMVPMRDGVLLATDVYYPAGARAVARFDGAHTLRQIGSEPFREKPAAAAIGDAARGCSVLRRSRLRGHYAGLPWQVPLRGDFYQVPE